MCYNLQMTANFACSVFPFFLPYFFLKVNRTLYNLYYHYQEKNMLQEIQCVWILPYLKKALAKVVHLTKLQKKVWCLGPIQQLYIPFFFCFLISLIFHFAQRKNKRGKQTGWRVLLTANVISNTRDTRVVLQFKVLILKPMLERPKALSANQLGTWHSYWREHYSEPCMIRKGVVIRPSTFLHLWREQNCIFYTETYCLLLCIIWTALLLPIIVALTLIWCCWIPDLLLHPNYTIPWT